MQTDVTLVDRATFCSKPMLAEAGIWWRSGLAHEAAIREIGDRLDWKPATAAPSADAEAPVRIIYL